MAPLGGIPRKRSNRNARQRTRSFPVFAIARFLTLPNTTRANQNWEPFKMKGVENTEGTVSSTALTLAEEIRQTGCRSPQDLLPRIEQAEQLAATTTEPNGRRACGRTVSNAQRLPHNFSAALEKHDAAIPLFESDKASDQIGRIPLAKAVFLLSGPARSLALVGGCPRMSVDSLTGQTLWLRTQRNEVDSCRVPAPVLLGRIPDACPKTRRNCYAS